jgi:hypothetical protein
MVFMALVFQLFFDTVVATVLPNAAVALVGAAGRARCRSDSGAAADQ